MNIADLMTDLDSLPQLVVGSVHDGFGNPISVNIIIERWITSQSRWDLYANSLNYISFSFTLDDDVPTGSHLFRGRILESAEYISMQSTFMITIGQGTAFIEINGGVGIIDVEYHQPVDLQIAAHDQNGYVIENMNVAVTVFNPQDSQFNLVGTGLTDQNGLVFISFVPAESYMSYPFIEIPIIITTEQVNYTTQDSIVNFRLISTTLRLNVSINDAVIFDQTQFVVQGYDDWGYTAEENTQIDLVIEGITYSISLDATGIGSLVQIFTVAGTGAMTVSYAGGFPYNATSFEVQYVIQKGVYTITINTITGYQGSTVDISAMITDHVGNAGYDVSVSVWIYDGVWINLANLQTTDVSNSVNYQYTILQGLGNYNLEWRIIGDANFNQTITGSLLEVDGIETKLISTISLSYKYGTDLNRASSGQLLINNLDIPLGLLELQILVNNTQYSWTITTDVNGEVFFDLPKYLAPGDYDLVISFDSDSTHTTSFSTKQFTVEGTTTNLVWITQPQDAYHGDQVSIVVEARDEYDTLLQNVVVELHAGSVDLTATTNATGMVNFSFELNTSATTLDIHLTFLPQGGWESSAIATTINTYKLQMIIGGDLPNVVRYNDTIEFSFRINSTAGLADNILIELWYLDPMTLQFILLHQFYTDVNGEAIIIVDFPDRDAGTVNVIDWKFYHDLYYDQVLSQFIEVIPMDLQVMVDWQATVLYNHETDISFTIVDGNGNIMNSLQVTLLYAPVTVEYQETLLTFNGMVVFTYIPSDLGLLQLTYRIIDPSGNYIMSEGVIELQVQQTAAVIAAQWTDHNGELGLEVTVSSSNGLAIDDALLVELYLYDEDLADYQLHASGVLSQGLVLFDVSDWINDVLVKVMVHGNQNVAGDEITSSLTFQVLQTTFGIIDVSTYSPSSIEIELLGTGNLDGYTVLVYAKIFGNWELLFTTQTQNGTIYAMFDLTLQPGTYELKLEIPQQAWYYHYETISSLRVAKIQVDVVIIEQSYIGKGENNTIDLYLQGGTGYDYTGSIVYLYHDVDGQLEYLATATANQTGYVSFAVYGDTIWQIGQHTFFISLQVNDYLNEISLQLDLLLLQDVVLSYELIGNISLDDGGMVNVTLVTTSDEPLQGELIQIFVVDGELELLLVSGTTDANGNVLLQLPSHLQYFTILENGSLHLQLKIIYEDLGVDQENVNKEILFEQILAKSIVQVTLQGKDLGFTHGYELTIDLRDTLGSIKPEDPHVGNLIIVWRLETQGGVLIAEGELSWAEFSADPVIMLDQNFSEVIILTVIIISDTDSRYASDVEGSNVHIFEFQRDRITPELRLLTPVVDLAAADEVRLQILYDNITLRGVVISVVVNGTLFSVSSDDKGLVVINIDRFFIAEGNYSFTFSSYDGYYNEVMSWEFVIPVKVIAPTFLVEFANVDITQIMSFDPDAIITLNITDVYSANSDYRVVFTDLNGLIVYEQVYSLQRLDQLKIRLPPLLPGNYYMIVERLNYNLDVVGVSQEILITPVEMKMAEILADKLGKELVLTIQYNATLRFDPEYSARITFENGTIMEFDQQLNYTLGIDIFDKNAWILVEIQFTGFYQGTISLHVADPSADNGNILDFVNDLSQNSESVVLLVTTVGGVGVLTMVGRKLKAGDLNIQRNTKQRL